MIAHWQFQLQGHAAPLLREQDGAIYCSSLFGCTGIHIREVNVTCIGFGAAQAPIRIDGAGLSVENSSFTGCSALSDGGSLQALESEVVVTDSTFVSSSTGGSGGAISLVGVKARVRGARFINCSAAVDGGALSIVDYKCTRSLEIKPTATVEESIFEHVRALIFVVPFFVHFFDTQRKEG